MKKQLLYKYTKKQKKGEKKMFADITINEQEQAFQEQKALLDLTKKALTEAKRIDAKFNRLVNNLQEIFNYKPAYKEILKNMLGLKKEVEEITTEKVATTEEKSNILDLGYDNFKENNSLTNTTEIKENTVKKVEVTKIEVTNNINNNTSNTNIINIDIDIDDKDWNIEMLKDEMLSKNSKKELEDFKDNLGLDKVREIWNNCTIPEKNDIQIIVHQKPENTDRRYGTLGYPLQYVDPETKKTYNGRYLGFYLHGELITNKNQRAITIDGKGFIIDKKDIRGQKLTSLNKATSWEIEELELILSEPQPEPKTHTSSFDNIYNHVDNFHNISW